MQSHRPKILDLAEVRRGQSPTLGPKVSVITPNFNHGHYLSDTLVGVNRQTYQNLEHIIVDAASSDNTQEILREHPDVKWISEPDKGVLDAFLKGLRMSDGKYVMLCPSSDMYIDPTWVEKCVTTLESDPKLSMVWGGVATANMNGETIEDHSWPTLKAEIPSGIDMFFYWLISSVNLPETNYCLRKDVLISCLSEMDIPEDEYESDEDINLLLQYRFHSEGYLTKYLPVTANFVRIHEDQRTAAWQNTGLFEKKMARYAEKHRNYRRHLLFGASHTVRDSNGETIETLYWPRIVLQLFIQKARIATKGSI